MTNNYCELLDDYLDGDLSSTERALFEGHLSQCPECHQACETWQSGRRLLKSASEQLELPSRFLVEQIQQMSMRKVPAGRRQIAAVTIAACALIGAVISLGPGRNKSADLSPQATVEQPVSKPVASVRVSLPDNVIGVPVDIGDPNVTVVWMYSTTPNLSEKP
jgi:anti-sigma factor RsiW